VCGIVWEGERGIHRRGIKSVGGRERNTKSGGRE
jgi:hypothetical protein